MVVKALPFALHDKDKSFFVKKGTEEMLVEMSHCKKCWLRCPIEEMSVEMSHCKKCRLRCPIEEMSVEMSH